MKKKYTAIIKDGAGYQHRTDSDYSSKASYAIDCRANGYKVAAILTDKEIDFIANALDEPERYGLTFGQALSKLHKYSNNVVEYVMSCYDDITGKNQRYYFNSESEPEGVCDDYYGTLDEAREIAQRVANEIGEDVCINTCIGEEIVDVVSPDEPEQATAETAQNAESE